MTSDHQIFLRGLLSPVTAEYDIRDGVVWVSAVYRRGDREVNQLDYVTPRELDRLVSQIEAIWTKRKTA